jgi:hypothetical protein
MRFFHGVLVAAASAGLTALTVWGVGNWASRTHRVDGTYLIEQRLAAAHVEGKNVLLPAQVDEATLRWCIAEQLTTPPEIAVLGSSHTLQLSSEAARPFHVSNFSMSGGFLQDHMVTSGILDTRKKRPRVWAVLVDSWFFDLDIDFQQWRSRPHELASIETKLSDMALPPLPPLFRDRVAELLAPKFGAKLSLSPVTATLDSFVRQHTHVIVEASVQDALGTVLTDDGAIKAAGNHKDVDVNEARQIALRQFATNRDRHRYGTYSGINPQLWSLYQRWLQFLREDGAQVVIILTPYHPAIYGKIVADPKNQLLVVEDRVRTHAVAVGLPVVGSYDPAKVGMTEEDFFDGDHLREGSLFKLLGNTLSDAARTAGVPEPTR